MTTIGRNRDDLEALTRLMGLLSNLARDVTKLYGTEKAALGMSLMETTDQLTVVVGVLSERMGYTMDEVTRPLWQ